jgi:predicted MFS family arabinose efflux permease
MKRPGFLDAFQHRGFRLLWIGAFLSSIGTWIQDVALSWLIHVQTGDPFFLGLRRFAQDVPLIGLMLVGGAVADRVDRRGILLTSQVVQMLLAVALAGLYFAGHLGIAAILVIAFLAGLTQSQSAPTYQAVLPSLVPREHIPNAVALNSLQFNTSRAIGPVIAGLLLAQVGIGACFVANAASFVVVILVLWWIRFPSPKTAGGEGLVQTLRTGVRHVAGTPLLRTFTLLAGATSFLGFPLVTFLPTLAGDVLETGSTGYSLLLTSLGVGAIIGALTTAQRGSVRGRGRYTLLHLVAFGLVTSGAVFSRWQWLSMLLLVGSGHTLTTALSTLSSLVQEHTPDELRGRVMSIFGLAFRGGLPLGSLVGGLVVRQAGVPAVLGVSCAVLAVVAATLLLRHRELRAL